MQQDNKLSTLNIYNDALNFSNLIWTICIHWSHFNQDTFGSQLIRSADSISANIAEGYGRYHYNENLKFCYYARGSFMETLDWLEKAYYRKLISDEEKVEIEKFTNDFLKSLNAYIKYIRNCRDSQKN